MEDVRINLKTTKEQLSQVEFAISNGQTGEDIYEARDQLKEVVELLEESLLSYEKSRLLAMLDADNPPNPSTSETPTNPVHEVEPKVEESEATVDAAETCKPLKSTNEDEKNLLFLESIADVDDVSGMKCQAPYHTEWSGTQYHNAMIVGLSSSTTTDGDLPSVDVLFLNPFIEKMKPCPYYLEGDCKFTEETCKFSHGYCVGIDKLHLYKECNYEEFKAGQSCLAKLPSGIWSKATIASVEKGINCTVKFVEQNLTAELSIDEVLPNSSNEIHDISSDDEEEVVKTIGDTSYSSTYEKGATGAESSIPLGAWEEHTRGIGSKIMKKFGYKEGEGLGRNGQGRVVPVPIVILPPGKSLDYCAEKKKKKEKAVKKKEQRAASSSSSTGASVAAAAGGNVFKFLNKTLAGGGSRSRGGGDASGKSMRVSKSSSSFKLKGSRQQDLEMSQKLVRNHSMINAKKEAIKKLNVQIQRNTLTNPAVAEQFRAKLRQITRELKSLESSNATLETQKKMKKDFKSMVKF